MSYPSKIHTLVIEDEKGVRDNYSAIFKELFENGDPVMQPTFAPSYGDARARLEGRDIYHLVILDLGLPVEIGLDAELDYGELLLKHIAQRENYPVPALLVISGRLNDTKVHDIQEAVEKGFWYGKIVSKGHGEFDEIKKAIEILPQYCGVGIHIQDSGQNWYPTLSPREEDMLRRCVLSKDHIGLDLRWWRAERGDLSAPETSDRDSTKVLMGRFLLDGGLGSSRPTFFKFGPAAKSEYTFRNAKIMDEKLRHIQVGYTAISLTRSLLVTQNVCDADPIGLDDFLASETDQERSLFASVVSEIWEQLEKIGPTGDEEVKVKDVLWSYLDREAIETTWSTYGTEDIEPSPLALFDQLKASGRTEWAKYKDGNHGDLNASNIAVERAETGIRAFIFDAGSIEKDIAAQDLACLEATSILFPSENNQLMTECDFLYKNTVVPPEELPLDGTCQLSRHLARLIAEIRITALSVIDEKLYALLVFDAALRQLYGFAFPSSENKIADGRIAAEYAVMVGRWLSNVAPEFFNESVAT